MTDLNSTFVEGRISEALIDRVIVSTMRDPFFSAKVLDQLDLGNHKVKRVIAQRKHFASTGSIDVVTVLTDDTHLLIENKVDAGYSMTRDALSQPDRYKMSVEALTDNGTPAYSVLVAPSQYLASTRSLEAFDKSLSYENLAECLIGESRALLIKAIEQASLPYEPVPSKANMRVFEGVYAIAGKLFPDLHLKNNPNASNARPKESVTVYVDIGRTLQTHDHVPKPRMSLQLRETGAKIMLPKLAQQADRIQRPPELEAIGATFVRAGQSLGIKLPTEQVFIDRKFDDQTDAVIGGLAALDTLRQWWNGNPVEVKEIISQSV